MRASLCVAAAPPGPPPPHADRPLRPAARASVAPLPALHLEPAGGGPGAGYGGETILPTGIVNVIFDLGSTPYSVSRAGESWGLEAERVKLVGVQTTGYTARPAAGVHLLGVCVHAERAAALLALPMRETTDTSIEAGLVLPGADEVWDRLCEAPDFAARCRIVIPWLTGRVRARRETGLLAHACRSLGASRAVSAEESGVGTLAKSLYVSERHLRRLFVDQVGLTPSGYLRLSRFAKSMHLLAGCGSLTEVALGAGYYDQAHFCRDFKAISRITPTEYRQAMGPVPGHLFLA